MRGWGCLCEGGGVLCEGGGGVCVGIILLHLMYSSTMHPG